MRRFCSVSVNPGTALAGQNEQALLEQQLETGCLVKRGGNEVEKLRRGRRKEQVDSVDLERKFETPNFFQPEAAGCVCRG